MEKIYLDKAGYNDLLQKIEILKQILNENDRGRKEAFEAGAGDGWDSPEFEEIERNNLLLSGQLKDLYDELSRVEIVEKGEDNKLVDLNDILLLEIINYKKELKEMIVKLVGASGDLFASVPEISINSPIGAAIYKKSVGDVCTYAVDNNSFSVVIKEKLDLEQAKGRTSRR